MYTVMCFVDGGNRDKEGFLKVREGLSRIMYIILWQSMLLCFKS